MTRFAVWFAKAEAAPSPSAFMQKIFSEGFRRAPGGPVRESREHYHNGGMSMRIMKSVLTVAALCSLVFFAGVAVAAEKKAAASSPNIVVTPPKAPKAVGPYSQGIISGGFVFTSGQLPLDPATNTMPADVKAQAKQSMDNVKAVLEAAGSGMDKVVKVTIFVKDLNDFNTVNEVYATYFKGNYPARSCVQVARIPRDALVEIEAIAKR